MAVVARPRSAAAAVSSSSGAMLSDIRSTSATSTKISGTVGMRGWKNP